MVAVRARTLLSPRWSSPSPRPPTLRLVRPAPPPPLRHDRGVDARMKGRHPLAAGHARGRAAVSTDGSLRGCRISSADEVAWENRSSAGCRPTASAWWRGPLLMGSGAPRLLSVFDPVTGRPCSTPRLNLAQDRCPGAAATERHLARPRATGGGLRWLALSISRAVKQRWANEGLFEQTGPQKKGWGWPDAASRDRHASGGQRALEVRAGGADMISGPHRLDGSAGAGPTRRARCAGPRSLPTARAVQRRAPCAVPRSTRQDRPIYVGFAIGSWLPPRRRQALGPSRR